MAKFIVHATVNYDGDIVVNADSESDAMEQAEQYIIFHIDQNVRCGGTKFYLGDNIDCSDVEEN